MFNEKPPMLGGDVRTDLAALRDYLFRMVRGLEDVTTAAGSGNVVSYGSDGKAQASTGTGNGVSKDDIEKVRKNAEELKALIIKSADEMQADIEAGDQGVVNYVDRKTEEYDSLYVAKSDYGTFTETINNRIEVMARGVVESYNYASSIQSVQDNIDLVQNYLNSVNAEIRRGIVQDPETGEYVAGIAISQALSFTGECGPADSNNPGDGYTYYYLTNGQTFGLYTSTGWQFWINGYKTGWFDSTDSMLHVNNIYVEQQLNIRGKFVFEVSSFSSSAKTSSARLRLRFIGE